MSAKCHLSFQAAHSVHIQQIIAFHEMASHVVEQFAGILCASALCIHVNKGACYNHIQLKASFMMSEWSCLPCSRAASLAHAFKATTKKTLSGAKPVSCIC
ncbi:hypothetical protein O6H91_Y420600 [Diphasiastrum complanatum]|nr:hypothetical protein O6H91_Y420600 [Diphasiastrum complanatum]